MPTSDGHFTTRDLCTSVVDTRVIAAAAVTQEKIANLAVGTAQIDDLAVDTAQINTAAVTKLKVGDQEIDVQRMLDPVATAIEYDGNLNTSWTTSETTHATDTITVPSWTGTAAIRAMSQVQITAAASQTVNVRCAVAGTPSSGSLSMTVVSGDVSQSHDYEWRDITSPGATITVDTDVWLNTGTNSTNWTSIRGDATFLR